MYDAKAMGRRVRSKCVDRGITYKELADSIAMGLFLAFLGASLVILAACGIGGTACWILG